MTRTRVRKLRLGRLLRSPAPLLAVSILLALGTIGGALAYGHGGAVGGAPIAWSQKAGSGTVFPACGSATGSVTCSGGAGNVTMNWNFSPGGASGSTQVDLVNSGGSTVFAQGYSGVVGSANISGLGDGTYYFAAVPSYSTGADPSNGVHSDLTVSCATPPPTAPPPTCALSATANGVTATDITVNVGDNVSYAWSSADGTSWSGFINDNGGTTQTWVDAAGNPVANTPGGFRGGTVAASQAGHSYGISYYVAGPGGSTSCPLVVHVRPAPPPPPPWIAPACNVDGTSVSLSWGTVSGATGYYPRVYTTLGSCPSGWLMWSDGHTCYVDNYPGTSITFGTNPGSQYNAWIYAGSASGVNWSDYTATGPFTCGAPTGGTPTATLRTNTPSVCPGGSATLTWDSTNATSCTGSNFSTGGATTGSAVVSPSVNTPYGVTCSGPGGSASDGKNVIVLAPSDPSCTALPDLSAWEDTTPYPQNPTANDSISLVGYAPNYGAGAYPSQTFPNLFQVTNAFNGGGSVVAAPVVNASGPIAAYSGSGTPDYAPTVSPRYMTAVIGKLPAGNYSYRVCANTNAVGLVLDPDSNANNNCQIWINFTVAAAPTGTITLTPNPASNSCGDTNTAVTVGVQATVDWDVRIGSPSGTLFAQGGPGSPPSPTGDWVTDGMAFYLVDRATGAVLDSKTETVTQACSLPDLTAEGTGVAPASTPANQSMALSSVIRNDGTTAANNFHDVFQIANNFGPSGVTELLIAPAQDPISTLPGSGYRTTISGSIPPNSLSVGTHYVRACADVNTSWVGSVTESEEGNNCGAPTPFTITAAPPTGSIAGSCNADGSVHLSWSSNAVSPSYSLAYWAPEGKTCAAGWSKVYDDGTNVNCQISNTTTTSANIPTNDPAGNSVWGSVSDTSTGLAGALTPTGAFNCVTPKFPNLSAWEDDSISSATLTPTTSITLTGWTPNYGNGPVPSVTFPNYFQIKNAFNGGGSTIPQSEVVNATGPIPADTSGGANPSYKTVTASIGTLPVGNYSYHLCADNNASFVGVVDEGINEGDNCNIWINFTVIPAPVTSIDAACNFAGTQATISWPASPGATAYYPRVGQPAGGSCPAGWTMWTDGTTCYVNSYLSTSITFNTVPGTSYTAWVHPGDPVNWDNAPSKAFMCPPPPDLIAGGVSPTSAEAGTVANFSATISNLGPQSTGATFYNLAQIDTDANHASGNEADLGITDPNPMPLLASGASAPAVFAHTFASAGTYYLRVCADKSSAGNAGTILETNENNNCGPWTEVTVSGGGSSASCTLDSSVVAGNLKLSWTSTGAASLSIDQGVGAVTPVASGNKTIALPSAKTTYTMRATDPNGLFNTCDTTYTPSGGGGNNPACQPATQPINAGDTATLTASGGSGGGYQWYNATTDALLGSGATLAKAFSKDTSIYVKDSANNSSPTCSVTMNGGGGCGTLSDSIHANPTRLPGSSGTTKVSWQAQEVTDSCIITKNGVTDQTVTSSACNVDINGNKDYTITEQTKFCITCDGDISKKKCVVVDLGSDIITF